MAEPDQMVPRTVLVPLAHGYMQAIADECGADLLHVKGPAVDPSLLVRDESGRPRRRYSLDVDVLVRPSHVDTLIAEMERREWYVLADFENASAFAHAANMRHERLGDVDLHRDWPGLGDDPARAFDLLWERRTVAEIAHVRCEVPDVDCQRLMMLLHIGRTGGPKHSDYEPLWARATEEERAETRRLAVLFDAEVALAAGLGELEQRGMPATSEWRLHGAPSCSSVTRTISCVQRGCSRALPLWTR